VEEEYEDEKEVVVLALIVEKKAICHMNVENQKRKKYVGIFKKEDVDMAKDVDFLMMGNQEALEKMIGRIEEEEEMIEEVEETIEEVVIVIEVI